jgi:hypothetical protein
MADFMSHVGVPIAIGGSGNTSQKLMQLRVLLQFIAIIVIMFTVWIMAK